MSKTEEPRFEQIVEWIRSTDPMTYEGGYFALLGHVDQHKDELLTLMRAETNPNIRGKFIELLGESHDPAIIPVLTSELANGDDEVKSWALSALENFGRRGFANAEAVAAAFRKQNPRWGA